MAKDLRGAVKRYERQHEEAQAEAFGQLKGIPYVNLINYPFVSSVISLIPQPMMQQFRVVAFMKIGKTVKVASPDPFQSGLAGAMNQLGENLNINFEPHVCSQSSFDYAIKIYPVLVKEEKKNTNQVQEETEERAISSLQDLQKAVETVSTTQLLETLFAGAVALSASDIHFEPSSEIVHVRFRIDGRLLPVVNLPAKSYRAITSRVKTAAHIKLDKLNTPQDGRFSITVGAQPIDIRANTAPTTFGETIELRLLNYKDFLTYEQLGINERTKKAILASINKPSGLVLFTGPTGSGKTTSLYAALSLLNRPDRKIITIEDPVEYRLEGIEQIQIDPSAGFDFAQALRGVLRQDPNVIMVGEVRDKETGEIAANASITGHLVLSTLHTTNASLAFTRLMQMGVPKYLLADAISLIVAQRLVRKICLNCQGKGCHVCNQTGFKGRILICEHFIPDSKTVDLIRKEAPSSEFQQLFLEEGYQTMLQDGLDKVRQGITTEQEVREVTS